MDNKIEDMFQSILDDAYEGFGKELTEDSKNNLKDWMIKNKDFVLNNNIEVFYNLDPDNGDIHISIFEK